MNNPKHTGNWRWGTVALWVIRVLLCVVFLLAGGLKLSSAPMMVKEFHRIGLGQWFRYFTAGCEIAGAVLIITPFLAGFGALLLMAVMAGAAVFLKIDGLPGSVFLPLAFGVLATIVFIARRRDVLRWRRKARRG